MSATDELRRMLDERGVEWWEDAFSSEYRTVFDGKDGVRYCVYQLATVLFISSILPVTPEQAIAATLGGTCELEELARDMYKAIVMMIAIPSYADAHRSELEAIDDRAHSLGVVGE